MGLTASIFLDDSVVAALGAIVSDWEAGDTITIDFLATDKFGEWDAVDSEGD